MGELKSAWEIAQEKANKLGKLSAEEEQQEREQRCKEIGKAMAQNYLERPKEQNIDLENYPKEEKKLLRQAILKRLVEAMDLKNSTLLERAIQGIAMVEPTSKPLIEQINQLVQEYEETGRKERRAIESKGREILHQLRLSGTAVGDINIEATSEWQEACVKIIEPFEARLDSLKQELICISNPNHAKLK